jgi:phage terminase large subunit-like protein
MPGKHPNKITQDKARAQRVLDFIEQMPVPSGVGIGGNFKLEPFQKDFIRDIYTPHRAGKRLVRRAVLSVARKNGKSALIACLALAHLCGPESERNGEIYSAANEREQAALIFKMAAQIVRAVPLLQTIIRVVDSTKTMVCTANGSFYKALSAEAGSKHGLNPTMVIYDELAQARNRELYDVLDTSMGARAEPLFVNISTQSNDPEHILSQIIDDGIKAKDLTTVVHLHETPEDADIWDEKTWYLSNPALDKFRTIEDMRALADRAKRLPSFESAFRNLFLNQRVDANNPLIPAAEWKACKGDAAIEDGEKVYLGLDLASTTDLCALVVLSAENGDRVQPIFWKPKENVQEHEKRDRAPYAAWAARGLLETPPGRAIDWSFIVHRLAEIAVKYQVVGLAYDRWRIENLLQEMGKEGLNAVVEGKDFKQGEPAPSGSLRLVPWGQGFRDMAAAIDSMETSIIERHLIHDGHPVLTWCISNAFPVSDPAGNRKLDKSKARFRIDGAVALAMAKGLKARDGTTEAEPSVYETRGLSVF